MGKFTCPFCIREYELKKTLYVCRDCGETTTPSIFEREPIKCKKSGCGGTATQRKCPFCGEEIPKTALETPNLPFSVVGVSNSGKTNYITVMLQELESGAGLKLALAAQNQDTRAHHKMNYTHIYEDHIPPGATLRVSPQIWSIKNTAKLRNNTVPTYTFTIFDGAGEDHETKLDTTSAVCRYINASKAIILTLDPLILSSIRRGGIVDPVVMKNSLAGRENETKNAVDIVNTLASYIKTARGIKSTQLLDIPVAVVLTKFDTLLSHKAFGPSALIKSKSLNVRDGKVDMAEIQQVDAEICNWLEIIGEGNFITALRSNFKDFCFFGVSSYGSPPPAVNELNSKISPHRVLDPILWLFKKADFVD